MFVKSCPSVGGVEASVLNRSLLRKAHDAAYIAMYMWYSGTPIKQGYGYR